MAFTVEKPMKEFITRFQKDLTVLQRQIKKEGDDLVRKVKKVATKKNIDTKRREIERLVEANLRKFEPKINSFVHQITIQAKKAGIDLTDLERSVKSNLRSARSKIKKTKAKKTTKKTTRKTTKTSTKTTKKRTTKAST